ncbi:hypothetical protein DSECCO2_623650 [anaerobic digester metagenome]
MSVWNLGTSDQHEATGTQNEVPKDKSTGVCAPPAPDLATLQIHIGLTGIEKLYPFLAFIRPIRIVTDLVDHHLRRQNRYTACQNQEQQRFHLFIPELSRQNPG